MMQHLHSPKALSLLCGALAALCVQGARAQEIDLGTAGQYAAFILGDASGLARVEGRLAVGRDLDSNRLDVGGDLPSDSVTLPALVVGRNISRFKHGTMLDDGGRKGFGVYAGGKANTFVQLDLRKADLPVDFEAETNWLTMLSARLAAKPATGSVSAQANVITLRGSDADLEVFSLNAAQVGPSYTIKLVNVKAGAWLVLNVRSDAQRQVKFNWNQDALKPYQQRVLFNFPDTDVLRFDGAKVWGSILAPFACAKSVGGRVDGTVIVATWSGQTDIGHAPFVAGP